MGWDVIGCSYCVFMFYVLVHGSWAIVSLYVAVVFGIWLLSQIISVVFNVVFFEEFYNQPIFHLDSICCASGDWYLWKPMGAAVMPALSIFLSCSATPSINAASAAASSALLLLLLALLFLLLLLLLLRLLAVAVAVACSWVSV